MVRNRPGPAVCVRISPSRPLRPYPVQVALRGIFDRRDPSRGHHAIPPAAVDPVEAVGTDAIDDATDLISGERNEIRIAAHEADEADIRHDRDRVADQERAAAVRAVRPMERRAAIEVTTALNERDA